MPSWLSAAVEGWSSPCSEDPGLVARGGRGLDDQLGGHGSRRQRRAGSVEEESRRIGRASGSCSKSRGGNTRCIFKRRRSKEEEEEVWKEEEEREGEGPGKQTLEGFVREDGAGSRPHSSQEALEAGQEDRKKEKSKVELFGQQFIQLRRFEHRGGGDLRDFRSRGSSDVGLEQDPRMFDSGHTRPHAEGVSAADWPAVGVRPGVTPSSFQSVLEECTRRPSFETDVARDADIIVCAGFVTPGESSGSLRRCDPEIEIFGTDLHRGGFPNLPATGAGTGRDGQHVVDSGNAGSFPTAARGSEGEGRWKRMGSKIRKRGRRFLGSKRKVQERRQPQREGQRSQRRWPKRRWKERRGGEREEAVSGFDGEETLTMTRSLEDLVSPAVKPGCQGRWFVPSHTPPLAEDDAVNSFGPSASKTDGNDAGVMHDYEAVEIPKRCPPSADFLARGAGLVRLRSFLKEGLSGLKFHELSQTLCECFDEILSRCGLKHCKVQRSGGVFPLPETLFGLSQCFSKGFDLKEPFCLLAICKALNSYYGATWNDHVVITAAKRSSVEALASYAEDASQWEEKIEGVRWGDLLSTRSVDYKGDEVRVSMRFRWENIKDALPDEVGKIPLEDVCDLGTHDFVTNFEDYLLPAEARIYTKPPKVMVEEGSWEHICSGLLANFDAFG